MVVGYDRPQVIAVPTGDAPSIKEYPLPAGHVSDALNALGEQWSEGLLEPTLIRQGNLFNLYWKEVPQAASYSVTLYRAIFAANAEEIRAMNRSNQALPQWAAQAAKLSALTRGERVLLYRLADYEMDRGTHFLSVGGLVGENFIFRVTALDRAGNAVAFSRDITDGCPRDF